MLAERFKSSARTSSSVCYGGDREALGTDDLRLDHLHNWHYAARRAHVIEDHAHNAATGVPRDRWPNGKCGPGRLPRRHPALGRVGLLAGSTCPGRLEVTAHQASDQHPQERRQHCSDGCDDHSHDYSVGAVPPRRQSAGQAPALTRLSGPEPPLVPRSVNGLPGDEGRSADSPAAGRDRSKHRTDNGEVRPPRGCATGCIPCRR